MIRTAAIRSLLPLIVIAATGAASSGAETLATAHASAQTTIVFDELNATTAGSDSIQYDGPLYESFSTGSSKVSLSDVMAKLVAVASSSDVAAARGLAHAGSAAGALKPRSNGTVTVALYSDNYTHPGTLLVNLGTASDAVLATSQNSNFDFPLSTPYVLQPNTRYWIGFSTTNGSPAGLAWTNDESGTGAATEFNYFQGTVYPNSSGPYQIRVTVQPTAAPPPPPQPVPNITGVVSGASYLPQISSGSWVTIQGTDLAVTTRTWTSADFINGALPTKIDTVSVTINGKAAYIYYVDSKQLNVLSPDDVSLGSVAVQVTNTFGTSNTFTATKLAVAPGLFMFTSRYPAAVHLDGTYAGPANLISGATTTPVHPGETLILFGTGFGATTPAISTGSVFSTPAPLAQNATATIGGMTVNAPGYLISPGLYQFNVTIPQLSNGDAALTLSVAGQSTAAGVYLFIQN